MWSIHGPMTAARNSRQLRVNRPHSSSGRANLHALPDEDHPPMPCSQASLVCSWVGQRHVRRFMLMPSAALRRKRSHRLRSSASSESNRWRPWRRAFQSRSRRRLRKCRAAGVMCPTWFSLPTKVSSSDLVAPRALRSRSMSSRQARCLLQGSLSGSRRVSASHPKRHSASEGVPSASSFLMEARSSLGSGSLSDAGRPSAWMARRVAADIRSLLSPRSGAAAMRSSTCGSTMPSLLSGRVAIMSRAGANGTSSPSTLGRPTCFCWGLWSSDGSQSEHCRRGPWPGRPPIRTHCTTRSGKGGRRKSAGGT